ncbi:MAG: hypothetical protein GVY34_07315 [Alphaproteobacteria bacterium]|jgi:hypothetical protein|nr:hypothetical protein [Alphaproteobacteria bacterium]
MTTTLRRDHGRRRESLAARQARVGIVANPHVVTLPRPVPRDVWTRWPDLRATKRRAQAARAGAQDRRDLAAMDAFVRSVRRSGPRPDPAPDPANGPVPDATAGGDDTPVADGARMRRLLAGLVTGAMLLCAAVYLWRVFGTMS